MSRQSRQIREQIYNIDISRRTSRTIPLITGLFVFIVVYALILPALALEEEAYCGLEAHEHSASCYEQVLICKEKEHQHSAGCYDQDGKCICGLKEHVHGDSCYEEKLVCGKKRHIHEEACYKKPEQENSPQKDSWETRTLTAAGTGYTVTLTYGRDAKLPEDVKLFVREIKEDAESKAGKKEYQDCLSMAEKSLEGENKREITGARFFDITLISGDKEVEPASPVSVNIDYKKADTIDSDTEVSALHLGGKAEADILDVEVKEGRNKSENKTKVKGVEFAAESFSVYGIVYTVDFENSEHVVNAKGKRYEVTVTYGEDAAIPEHSSLRVTEYDSESAEYKRAYDKVVEYKKNKDTSFSEVGMGFEALDISIIDPDGKNVEPGAPVQVSVKRKTLPEDADKETFIETAEVQHIIESEKVSKVDVVADNSDSEAGHITVSEETAVAHFTVESFSTYTITWGGGLNGRYIQDISTGDYIIYAQDADNGNYYALVPGTNTNTDLNSVQLTYNNGQLSYSGSTNLYWHVTVNGNGNDRTFTVSNRQGNNTYYVYPRNENISDGSTSNLRVRTNSYTWRNWSDRIFCAGDTFLRSYRGTFQVWNQNNANWMNMTNVFFARPGDVKTVTVHYGYMNGDTFVEFDDLPEGAQTTYGGPTQIGDQLNVRYDLEGKDYVTTRIGNPSNGTQISPMLQTEAKSADYWKYRVLTTNGNITEWHSFGDNENDIYVIYRDTPTQKSYDDHGLNPEDLAAPVTSKNVQSNNNGTYDIDLSVTGTSNSMTNKTHANVVIVLDTSSSMNGTDTGESGKNRLDVAKKAIGSLADQLFGFNSSDDPAAIELAFVNFSHRVRNEQTMNTIYSGTSSEAFKSMINATSENGGTNYDTAIEAANSILWNDADPVYVVFVTDGDTVSRGYLEYDESGAKDHASDWDGGTYYTGDTATYGETYLERARSAAKLQVDKILTDPNNKFYSIGVFGTVKYLKDLGGTYLGQANEQAKIKEAFAKIIDEIALDLGYEEVTIHDGITAMTSTTLVNGIADQFRYEITQKDGTKKEYANGAALHKDYPEIGLAEYDSDEKAVKWEFGEGYQLGDGVTYKVIFTVWPSQEAYDLLAELNNGTKDFETLSEAVKRQIVVEGGKYYLKTNTYSTIDYTSFKTKDGEVIDQKTVEGAEIKDPKGKMILDGTGLQMKKQWNDSLDPAQLLELLTAHLNADKTDTTYEVVLRLWQDKNTSSEKEIATGEYPSPDGFIYKPTVTIADGEVTAASWPTIDVAIAPGVLVTITDENDSYYDAARYPRITYGSVTYAMLETGHEYVITEDDTDLHFELNTDVYHPMVVDGRLKTVKFGSDGSSITEMSSDNTELSTLTATNDLKGGLEIHKYITTKDDKSDTVTSDTSFFTFKIKLQKSEEDDTPAYTTPEQFNPDGSTILGSLGFRIFASADIPEEAANIADDKSSYEYNGNIFRANFNNDGEITGYTARGTVPSSGEITLKIRSSDVIRVVNLPAGTYYTVEEVANSIPAGYQLIDQSNTSGSVPANTQALAEFWNKRTSFIIDLLKVDELDADKVLAGAEFTLYKEDGSTPATDAEGNKTGTIKTGSDGKAEIGRLSPGTYKLVETAAPKGYTLMSSPVTIIVGSEKVTFQQGSNQPVDADKSSDGLTWTVTATNNAGVELPSTGGPGTSLISFLGFLLTGLAAAGLMMRKITRRQAV